ncbi:MAG TPA: aldo/keto reductase, partial [Rubrobacteraceae bacterium]|nr:aldo/keto reductase [Rubrobacteraceae bacterium]
QNRYNLTDRSSEAVLQACEREGVGFIPWSPLATGRLARPGGPLEEIAVRHEATPSQVALAWLLRHSPAMLPIPGTSSTAHLEENVAATTLGSRTRSWRCWREADRRRTMDAGIAGSGNIGATAAPCLEFSAYLSRF